MLSLFLPCSWTRDLEVNYLQASVAWGRKLQFGKGSGRSNLRNPIVRSVGYRDQMQLALGLRKEIIAETEMTERQCGDRK